MRKIRNLILHQIISPFSYLRMKHEDKKIYDWLLPGACTLICLLIIYFFVPSEKVVGNEGLIHNINEIISSLPGFFIAALAAAATLQGNNIDLEMNNSPHLPTYYEGEVIYTPVTRRRFLCSLFSFLTGLSIILSISTNFALSAKIDSSCYTPFYWIGISIFLFFVWQLVLATFLGLYYLGERLHVRE